MAEIVDVDAYICGGYFLTKRVSRPSAVSKLVPDWVTTVSECFTDIAPDTWADREYNYGDEERAEEALKFGVPATAIPALVDVFTQAVRPAHLTNAFPTLSVAQSFYRHCTDKNLIVLVGIGLERSLVQNLRTQLQDDVNNGYMLIERVNENTPLEHGGKILGYEPLGFDATKFHSWLCHDVLDEVDDRFGIRPNRAGFIDSLADAVRVTRDLKATGAETAIWEPWLVVQYGSGELGSA
jgi:hypothetical protein